MGLFLGFHSEDVTAAAKAQQTGPGWVQPAGLSVEFYPLASEARSWQETRPPPPGPDPRTLPGIAALIEDEEGSRASQGSPRPPDTRYWARDTTSRRHPFLFLHPPISACQVPATSLRHRKTRATLGSE